MLSTFARRKGFVPSWERERDIDGGKVLVRGYFKYVRGQPHLNIVGSLSKGDLEEENHIDGGFGVPARRMSVESSETFGPRVLSLCWNLYSHRHCAS